METEQEKNVTNFITFLLIVMIITIGFGLFKAGQYKMANEICTNMDLEAVIKNGKYTCITEFEKNNPQFNNLEQEIIDIITEKDKEQANKLFKS